MMLLTCACKEESCARSPASVLVGKAEVAVDYQFAVVDTAVMSLSCACIEESCAGRSTSLLGVIEAVAFVCAVALYCAALA